MAAFITTVCEIWLAIGGLVGIWFIIWPIGRIDPAARGAYVFRLLLLPGLALLWPFVLYRWRALSQAPDGGH